MYDDIRRMFREVNAVDEMRRALDEASLRHVREVTRIASERLGTIDDFAMRQAAVSLDLQKVIDPFFGYNNLFDVGRAAAHAWSDSLRPPLVAMVDKLLAGVQVPRPPFDYEVLTRDMARFAAQERYALNDAYEKIRLLQRQMVAPWESLSTAYSDALRPLLTAQATWARIAQIPSSATEFTRVVSAAQALVDQVYDFATTFDTASSNVELTEEEAKYAVAVANERLGAAFEQRNPLRLIHALAAFLNQLKTGVIRLAPSARHLLFEIFLHTLAFLISQNVVEPLLHPDAAPRVDKEVVRQIKRVRREIPDIPRETRIVIARGLMVRRAPTKNSPLVGHLYAGDIVSLEETRTRSWSLIVFEDEDGEVLVRGWVFSRYIKPLRGKIQPARMGRQTSGKRHHTSRPSGKAR